MKISKTKRKAAKYTGTPILIRLKISKTKSQVVPVPAVLAC